MSATESKSGRSLSQSIIFGLILAGAFLLSVLIIKELFVVLAALACAAGAWEICTALRIKDWYVARVPVALGSAAMLFFTYYGGERMQWISAWVVIAALMVWRGVQLLIQRKLLARTFRETVRDFSAAAFVVVYLPRYFVRHHGLSDWQAIWQATLSRKSQPQKVARGSCSVDSFWRRLWRDTNGVVARVALVVRHGCGRVHNPWFGSW